MAIFKFIFQSETLGSKEITQEPVGWDSTLRGLTRNMTYYGMFRKFTGEYTFFDDAYDYLKLLYDTDGINADCSIFAYQYVNNQMAYSNIFEGRFDFSTYKETFNGKPGITLTIVDNSFAEKIKAREEVELSFYQMKTCDNRDFVGINTFTPAVVYGTEVRNSADVNSTDTTEFEVSEHNIWILPELISDNEIINTVLLKVNNSSAYNFDTENCFFTADKEGTLHINAYIQFRTAYIPPQPYIIGSIRIRHGRNGSEFNSYSYNTGYQNSYDVNVFIEKTITNVLEGDVFQIECQLSLYPGVITVYDYHIIDTVLLNVDWVTLPEMIVANLILPFEAFNKAIEHITNEPNALSCEIFGRTDSPVIYPSDGKYSHISIGNGYTFRGFGDYYANISYTLKDLFQNFEKVLNIGAGIEYDNGYKFVIREKSEFFKDNVVHLFDHVQIDTFEKVLDSSMFYSDIEIGYAKSAYEEISGLIEFNNIEKFNTIISAVKNKLELVSDIRADGSGITFAMFKNRDNAPTEDTQYDKDIWFLELKRLLVSIQDADWRQRLDEDFDTVSGLDYIEHPINLNLTPKRNLYRWGWMLANALQKYSNSIIKCNGYSVSNELETKRTDETLTLTELGDELASDIGIPIFSGKLIRFKSDVTFEDFAKIEADPYGLIGVKNPNTGEYCYGWLKEISTQPIDKVTNIELIEAIDAIAFFNCLGTEDGIYITTEDGKLIRI